METIHKIGRRKTSVARIYLKKGKGNFTINTKDWKDYFPTSAHQFKINQPFNVCDNVNKFDMTVNVYGGGMTCLLYTSPSPRDRQKSRMPSSA